MRSEPNPTQFGLCRERCDAMRCDAVPIGSLWSGVIAPSKGIGTGAGRTQRRKEGDGGRFAQPGDGTEGDGASTHRYTGELVPFFPRIMIMAWIIIEILARSTPLRGESVTLRDASC